MAFEIEIWDLGLFSVVSSLLLLMASEVIAPYYGKTNVLLQSRWIRYIGIGFGVFFLMIAIFKIITSIA